MLVLTLSFLSFGSNETAFLAFPNDTDLKLACDLLSLELFTLTSRSKDCPIRYLPRVFTKVRKNLSVYSYSTLISYYYFIKIKKLDSNITLLPSRSLLSTYRRKKILLLRLHFGIWPLANPSTILEYPISSRYLSNIPKKLCIYLCLTQIVFESYRGDMHSWCLCMWLWN